ncbi:hypothetical protein Pcinc_030479 [Petrolisthes cinctipes]|uniref:Uncharacterized protein n=1 Tax=Petrolisthes cinctipes TaxID=88211 RepID=A0AAE1K2H4_PETCI|nr:hypothetical protein Pcinc_030479 [Petrolisthes cinctipes]
MVLSRWARLRAGTGEEQTAALTGHWTLRGSCSLRGTTLATGPVRGGAGLRGVGARGAGGRDTLAARRCCCRDHTKGAAGPHHPSWPYHPSWLHHSTLPHHSSLPYQTFRLHNSCPQHRNSWPHHHSCMATSLLIPGHINQPGHPKPLL